MKVFKAATGTATWTLWAALVHVACGGGDTRFPTSIPATAVAGQLDESQQRVLCRDIVSYFSDVFGTKDECPTYGALKAAMRAEGDESATDSDLRAVCLERRQLCLDLIMPSDPDSCSTYSSECQATIGELGACFSDSNTFYLHLHASAPPCETLTRRQVTDFAAVHLESPSCEMAQAKCPNNPVVF